MSADSLSQWPLPLGYPGMRGPTGDRTLQARLAKQRCTPVLSPWSQRPGSNRLPPLYESGARPVVLRWHRAGGGSRTRSCRLTRPTRRRGSPAWVPSARFERALYGPSDRCLLPLGYEGEHAPRQGFEPRFPDPESGVLPVGRSGKGPAGTVPDPVQRAEAGGRDRYGVHRVASLVAVVDVERLRGVEPRSSPWQGDALPLCYNRRREPSRGLEPAYLGLTRDRALPDELRRRGTP